MAETVAASSRAAQVGPERAAPPHKHCVVPAGGFSSDRTRCIACKPAFFLPVRVLSRLFWRLCGTRAESLPRPANCSYQLLAGLQILSEGKVFGATWRTSSASA